MSAVPIETPRRLTVSEYLELENASEFRHEYVDGYMIPLVVDMAGNLYEHTVIAVNISSIVHGHLRGSPCRVSDSNLRVKARRLARYRYPDVTVVCGQPEFDPADPARMTVVNPRLVIEIISDSTEGADRGEKFDDYRAIASLDEYVLIRQKQPVVEVFRRRDDGSWLYRVYEGIETTARLESIGVDVALADVFAGVTFPPPRDDAGDVTKPELK
jgi:Uma2 family endonuclease